MDEIYYHFVTLTLLCLQLTTFHLTISLLLSHLPFRPSVYQTSSLLDS